jgi:muconate cycloisomerase
MIVGDVELFLIELPAGDTAVRSLLLRVTADSGHEGWGETRLPWRPGELPARRKALLAALAGREVHDIEAVLALDLLADAPLACGVEMALWDLVARAARQPLCHLLGGAYRPSIPLAVRLPAGPLENVAHWSRAFWAQGIATQTVAGAGTVESDLQVVAALGEACGQHVQFRLDCGGRYDRRAAAELVARLAPDSVEFVADPLAGARPEELAELRAAARVPLCACAEVRAPRDVVTLQAAVSHVAIDPARVGGLNRARWAAAVADAAGISAVLQTGATSGLATCAALQFAAATLSFTGALECSQPKLHDDILVDPLRTVDGLLAVPLAPGLGAQVDRDKVDWYQVAD